MKRFDGEVPAAAEPGPVGRDPGPSVPGDGPRSRTDTLLEIAGAWALAALVSLAAWRFLDATLATFTSALAWGGAGVAFAARAPGGLAGAGLAWSRPLRSLGLAGLYAVVVLPAFAVAFLIFHGPDRFHFPGPGPFIVATLHAFAFAALPEEIFFRGYVQSRLSGALPARVRRPLPFVPISLPIIAAAAVFAVAHVVFDARAERLLTFFPALLFGALREESGDVIAPALFHALCNGAIYGLSVGYTT